MEITNNKNFELWFKRPKRNNNALIRFFCFPFSGAGTLSYRSWVEKFPEEIELCLLQLPGRESRFREKPYDQIGPLIQTIGEIETFGTDLPFAFYGHSLGAIISFELIRQLRRQMRPLPVHLFVSGRRAPHLPNPGYPMHKLSDEALIEELRRFNGTPEIVLREPELLEIFLPIIRSDLKINETFVYQHEDPFDCPISAFGGKDDHKASEEELKAWSEHTKNNFKIKMFAGGHFFINNNRDLINEIIIKLKEYY